MKKLVLSTAIAGLMAVSANASASTLASAVLKIANFEIQHSDGTQWDISEFGNLSYSNSAELTANLTSTGGVLSSEPGIASPVDLAQLCVGGGCTPYAENDFSSVSTVPPTAHYAYSDQQLTGAGITGLGVPAGGADANTRGDVSLIADDSGQANSETGLNSTFVFTAQATDTMQFDFDAAVYLMAFASDDSAAPSKATAVVNYNISIIDQNDNEVLSFAHSDLNKNRSRDYAFTGQSTYALGDVTTNTYQHYTTGVATLVAGTQYILTVSQGANATAVKVPEPGSLALMGLGLLGLGAAARRRAKA